MNSCLMRKSIFSNNCFIKLNRKSSNSRHKLGSLGKFFCYNASFVWHHIISSSHCHNHFFHRSISSSFTKAINSTLNLSCSSSNASQRIGNSKAKVIMTVCRNRYFIYIRYIINKMSNYICEFIWN